MYPQKAEQYYAQSPTLGTLTKFTEKEIWDECDRIIEEGKKNKFTIGQNLYYNLSFFCNPKFFFDGEIEKCVEEFFLSTRLKMPIANNLYDADARTIDIFRLISEELNACENRAKEMNNGK